MNEAIAFDTHRYVKRLTKAGFSEIQAETLAAEQVEILNANLANKADIAEIRAEIESVRKEIESVRKEIESVRKEIKSVHKETKTEIELLRKETKTEIELLRKETKTEIELLRQESKAEFSRLEAMIEKTKSDLIKWGVGALLAQSGFIVAIIKFFVIPVSG